MSTSPRLLLRLQGGDTLLVQASAQAIGQFDQNRTFVGAQEEDEVSFRSYLFSDSLQFACGTPLESNGASDVAHYSKGQNSQSKPPPLTASDAA